MDLELLRSLKKLQKLTNEELSEKSGVPLGTINKVFSGATQYPRHDTIQAIAEALNYRPYEPGGRSIDVLKEALSYDVGRKYTVDDYYNLPSDVRAELIDGTFYFMEAPGTNHQALITELLYALKSYIKANHGSCRVFPSPYDVRLDNDNKTMVQPDLMIICSRDKIDDRRCNGAPDFIMEVVSAASSRIDYIKKLNKYLDAGVREYWIVDPDKRKVTVYFFENEDIPQHYSFQDKIPVGIFKDLVIDFAEIEKELF